ncbi:MAG: fatty acid desaturase, partial [Chthoniobacterales bacterium]
MSSKKSWKQIHWVNSLFLISTFLVTCTAVPAYIWYYGLSLFQFSLFFFFFVATGFSITLGYHRLFSHRTFQARLPVRLFTLLFGAAAFEGSALGWSADHRRHHKHVDHDEDPYDINKGFFHAHIGWLLFRHSPDTPLTWVRDLQKDRLAVWQHDHYVPIAILMGFGLPPLIGYAVGGAVGALGAFLIAGVARIVFVHHMTFFINSLCHWIGSRPYSINCSARDSALMAVFTFGEGYHNYHHEFQYDYRNGIQPWHFDPTKWLIWTLNRLGMASKLRTVPEETIIKARIRTSQKSLEKKLSTVEQPLPEYLTKAIQSTQDTMNAALAVWEERLEAYRQAIAKRSETTAAYRRELKKHMKEATETLRDSIQEWLRTHTL